MWPSKDQMVLGLGCKCSNVQLSMCLQIGGSDMIGYTACWKY